MLYIVIRILGEKMDILEKIQVHFVILVKDIFHFEGIIQVNMLNHI